VLVRACGGCSKTPAHFLHEELDSYNTAKKMLKKKGLKKRWAAGAC
jgi:hypothetical protein